MNERDSVPDKANKYSNENANKEKEYTTTEDLSVYSNVFDGDYHVEQDDEMEETDLSKLWTIVRN
jgi:hypothetical protein